MKKLVSLLLVFVLFLMPLSTAYAAIDFSGYTGVGTLYKGEKGSDVKTMQKALINLGYLPRGSADGSYGSKTAAAVKAFQRKNGFAGVVGYAGTATKLTQAAIFSSGAIPAYSSRSIVNDVSGDYGIYNSKLRYSTTLDGSFTFRNNEKRHVKALCVYYWLMDSSYNRVTLDGADFWQTWWSGLDLAQYGTKEFTISQDATNKELRKASKLCFIVGEIVYDNDCVFVTFNASKRPYNSPFYTLGSW